MKTYLLAHWQTIATGLMILAMGGLFGCQFLKERPATARLAVVVAVGKYIDAADRPAERAQRVRDVALKVLATANAAEAITVDALKAVALANLPASLSPTDRLLAATIIDVVVEELKARIKENALPAETLVTVKAVTQWVIDAAGPYLPQS